MTSFYRIYPVGKGLPEVYRPIGYGVRGQPAFGLLYLDLVVRLNDISIIKHLKGNDRADGRQQQVKTLSCWLD